MRSVACPPRRGPGLRRVPEAASGLRSGGREWVRVLPGPRRPATAVAQGAREARPQPRLCRHRHPIRLLGRSQACT